MGFALPLRRLLHALQALVDRWQIRFEAGRLDRLAVFRGGNPWMIVSAELRAWAAVVPGTAG